MTAAGRSRSAYLALIAAMASAALCTGLVASVGAQEIRDDSVVPGSYIVVYKDSIDSPGKATAQREQQLGFGRDYLFREAVQGFAAELSPRQVRSLESDPKVDFISENRRVEATGDLGTQASAPLAPGEPVPPTGVRRILSGTSTTVREAGANTAVIDTGIQLNHPDLNAAAGTDCINPGTPPDDGDGHGTHVAGTIGAKNNGSGVTGVAPNTKVYGVRVLNNKGSGTTASIICGIDWVTANQAAENIQVANMSLGGGGPAQGTQTCATTTDAMRAAICSSTAAGVRYVVAAGNDAWDFDYPPVPDVPAVYPEVMTVTAIADSDGTPGGNGGSTNCGWVVADDTPAPFSNFALTAAGAAHTIAAPGVCINSTVPGSTWDSDYSGTSMASPHVAGVVALCVNEAGADGPCASLTPGETIAHVRAEAQTNNTADPDYGFAGDPISSPTSKYYGFLTVAPPPGADTTPPDTTIDTGPAAGSTTNDSDPSFTFSSSETPSSFECRLDGGAWGACSSPKPYTGLADGPHTFEVRATDGSGNTDPTPASLSWTIDTTPPDTTPPDTTIDTGPAAGSTTNDSDPSFTFSSSETPSSFECRLDGGAWGACSSPKPYTGLADGPHTFEVRATDGSGNTDPTPASLSWTIDTTPPDTTPPDTTIDTGPAAGSTTNDSDPSFTFSSSETPSSFECRLDGGAWGACSSPKPYTGLADGPHTFEVRATDGSGNTDPTPASLSWTIDTTPPDTTPPDTTIDTGPAAGSTTNDSDPSFTFSSSETPSSFECRLDGGAWGACSSPKPYTGLADGPHTFEVRATDGSGNTDPTPASLSWTIDTTPPDTTPPDTTIDTGPAAGSTTNDSDPSFTFSSSETPSSFECRLDGGAWGACSSPKPYTGLADGPHTFEVRATDGSGNTDPTPASLSWTIDTTPPDTTPPDTTIDTGPAAGSTTNDSDPSFTFSSSETPSSFECRLDGGAWGACSSPKPYTGLADGPHTFEVRATDGSGNTDPTPASLSWTIDTTPPDTTPPDTTIDTGPAAGSTTNDSDPSFTFSSSETPSSFECRLDGGAWGACSSPKPYTGLADGPHTFEVRATDGSGNTDPTPASLSWTIDTTPPDTVIGSGPTDTITTDEATFTFSGTPAEDTANIQCRIDSEPFADCTSPKSFNGLTDGPHTAEFRAEDAAGNQDPTPASRTFTVDTTVTVDKAKIGKVSVKGPAKAKKGKKATYKVKITNSGNAKATGVRLKVKGRGVSFNTSVGKIGAMNTRTVKIKLKPKKPGKVKLAFKVTSKNAGGKTVKKRITVKK